jgi:hypothetical protein
MTKNRRPGTQNICTVRKYQAGFRISPFSHRLDIFVMALVTSFLSFIFWDSRTFSRVEQVRQIVMRQGQTRPLFKFFRLIDPTRYYFIMTPSPCLVDNPIQVDRKARPRNRRSTALKNRPGRCLGLKNGPWMTGGLSEKIYVS